LSVSTYANTVMPLNKKSLPARLIKNVRTHPYLYIMAIPVMAYYILFHYGPMYGAQIAFKEYSPGLGIWGSPWVGLKHFRSFINDIYFTRIVTNTIMISVFQLVFAFPVPIILALLINELTNRIFKKTVQTVIYMPHFISLIVICGLVLDFTSRSGVLNDIIAFFGGERINMMREASLFRPVYIISGIWQESGWGTIIYLAALAGVDVELYEAARIDGANKFQQIRHVTFPGILPTIVIMLILRVGSMMNVGYEKIILLYNSTIYSTADVISSYTYRKGLLDFNFSYSSMVGLFNSIINFSLVVMANAFSRRVNETSLW